MKTTLRPGTSIGPFVPGPLHVAAGLALRQPVTSGQVPGRVDHVHPRVKQLRGGVDPLGHLIGPSSTTISHDTYILLLSVTQGGGPTARLPEQLLPAPIRQSDVELEVRYCVGGVISPLLANVALNVLDEVWEAKGRQLGVLVRYADDHVALCPTKERAEQARSLVEATLAGLGLHLHPDKTTIVCLRGGAEGFDFLGFHHRMVQSWKRPGRWWLNKWPSPRAMASIRAKVRERTAPSRVGLTLEYVVEDLNPVLRGGGLISGKAIHQPSSARSTATSMNAWPGWPAGSTGSTGPTGWAASIGPGWVAWGFTGSPGRCATRRRTPVGERCRRAVCRRTARTVR